MTKISGRKIAVTGLTRAVLIPMRKEGNFVIIHKKGEKYRKFNLKFPFWHELEYAENKYRDTSLFSVNDEFDESYLKDRYSSCYIFKDDGVYVKPYVNIVYLDGNEKTEYFDTYEMAEERYNELVNKCDLKEVVNDCD